MSNRGFVKLPKISARHVQNAQTPMTGYLLQVFQHLLVFLKSS